MKVSICITAYNNEEYIEQAIYSVINQKVDFNFEILINDDASIDNTILVIQKIQKSHPNLITLITHDVNEFKAGKFDIYERNLFSIAKGKYIAMLDGDDYWSDENKLQLQVDFLDNNPEYSLVSNDTEMYFEDEKKFEPLVKVEFPKFLSNEAIINHGKNFFPTCSVLFRNVVKEYPAFMNCMSLDRKIAYLMMLYGKLGFIDRKMSVYRKYSSSVTALGSSTTKLKLLKGNIVLLNQFNEYTGHIYNNEIRKELSLQAKNILYFSEDIIDKEYKKYLSIIDFVKVIAYNILKKIRTKKT